MGEVYDARDTRLNRRVAIKILPTDRALDPQARARFDREAQAIAALNHRYICAIYDIGHERGTDFLVMERLDGQTLATRLTRGALPVPQAMQIAIEVADALDRAHRAGIVHRDLKPSNIMLTKEGSKLLAFGLAKPTPARGGDTTVSMAPRDLTAEGTLVGTVQYMAPEQLEGREADARSDIFAFGAVVYEMLTGRKAFSGSSQASVIAAVLQADPPPIAATPPLAPALDRAIRKCLAKPPDERWQSASDLRDELQWVAEQPPTETDSVTARSRARNRLIVPTLAAALAVAVTWAVVRSSDRAPSDVPISFTIHPPEGVVWGNTPPEPHPAVSPDGRRIAFVGDSDDGRGLWVRDLGDTQAHLVRGAMDLGGPTSGVFWSSDSTRVGYCVRGRLKVHHFDARPPDLLDAGCTSGVASWNSAGEILFRGQDGIFRISERGGPTTRVTTLDSSQAIAHSFPRWLPDGRRFIYTVVGPNPDVSGIYAGTLDGASRTRIVPDMSKTELVTGADGTSYLLFVRGRRLVAQPIDLAALVPVGDARVLAERMGIGNVALPGFSASATLLAHRSGGATRRAAWAWADRTGRLAGARYPERNGVSWVALSPDESTLVYTALNPDATYGGLWIVDFARRVEQPLFVDPSFVFLPAFSRSGRRIAFAVVEAGKRELYVMDFPSAAPVRVATSAALGLMEPEWAPDERALIGTAAFNHIVLVKLDSPGEAVTLVPSGAQAQLSPDGRWMAYTSAVGGTAEVYVQSFPEGRDRKRVSGHGGAQPRWRGDGTELFYLAADGTLMAVAVRTGARFEAGEPTPLFKDQSPREGTTPFDRTYLPTRDGQRFLLRVYTEPPVPLTVVRNWLAPAARD